MKQYPLLTLIWSLIPVFSGSSGMSEEYAGDRPSIDEIVNRTNQAAYYQGKDGRARVSMVITDSQGRKRNRKFTILRRDEPDPIESQNDSYTGDQKFYVYFQRPADVNKMVFMVWKHSDQATDDDRWLYLPALDLVKRIAGTEKRTSFVGSDFFYEDVSGRNINDDFHELEKITENYYVLKNTPKNPGSVEFGNYTIWVHKDTFIPVKIEYFDKAGEKYREYTALGVDNIQGFPTVTKASMKNLKTGSETLMAYENVQYDIGLPDDIFTERYLRKPPREYLR